MYDGVTGDDNTGVREGSKGGEGEDSEGKNTYPTLNNRDIRTEPYFYNHKQATKPLSETWKHCSQIFVLGSF